MKPKVLFTASTYSHIRSFHLPYLRAYQERGWEVHVACGGREGDIPHADAVFHLPFEKSMTAPANFKAASLLRKQIVREGYALVTTHTSLAAFFTRLAVLGMKNRPRVVNMAHGYLFDGDTPALKRQVLLSAERLVAPVTDLLLTMNQTDLKIARTHKLGRRVENVPGIGVDFSRLEVGEDRRGLMRGEFGIPQDAFVLFYAAEFSARKSQSVLIDAMELLPKNVYLVLAGDGALHGQCWQSVRDRGLENRVLFPGHVRDVENWYAMADAAVTSSRSEGLPFNVMEAMYCGLPVVASAVKGHTDLIEDGVTGLLYPYGDHAACARAVQALLTDPARCQALGAQGKQRVEPYALDAVLPVVMEQYDSVTEVPLSPLR